MSDPIDKKDELNSFVATSDDISELLELSLEETEEELIAPKVPLKIPSNQITISEPTKVINPSVDREIDYDFARKNLKDIIETSKSALDGLKEVAEQSQQPRAYEVLATLVNAYVEANQKLLEVHKKRQDLEVKEREARGESAQKITNNNLFVGSSSQLLELAKKLNKMPDESE